MKSLFRFNLDDVRWFVWAAARREVYASVGLSRHIWLIFRMSVSQSVFNYTYNLRHTRQIIS